MPFLQMEAVRVVGAPFAFDRLTTGLDEVAWDGPIRYVQSSNPIGLDGRGYLDFIQP
jgi:hypothetical protein